MPVYEAVKKKDFQKIFNFVKSQPLNSFSLACWKRTAKMFNNIMDMRLVEFLKTKVRFVVCEDNNGNIRVVLAVLRNLFDATNATLFCLMEESDYQSGNIMYLKEVFDNQIKRVYNQGITELRYFLADKHFDFAKQILGDSLEVIRECETDVYNKLFYVKVDFQKYLGAN